MQLTPEQVAAILEEAKPSIIKGLKEEVVRQANWEMNPLVSKLINEEVTAFMQAEIIPEIKRNLVEGKDGLLSVAITAANQITVSLAGSLTEELKKNLEQSYSRKKVFEALFT